MAYKKVWKGGTLDWKAVGSNAVKKAAVAARKRKKAAEVAGRKAARSAQTARNKAARERERYAKQRQREADKASRLRAVAAKAKEKARIADEKQKQKLIALAKKEEAKREKKLKRLNGLFLEHDIPLKLFDVDLREIALNFDEENGISSVSGFTKVTIPYLEENLFKLAINIHVSNTFGPLYESELKKVATTPEIYNHYPLSGWKEFKYKYAASLEDTLPNNLNFDDFSSFSDPVNTEGISEYLEVNILPVVVVIQKEIAVIEKKEQEAKQKAKEKKELDDACKKVKDNFDKTIAESVKIGKSMQSQISEMDSDLLALDKRYKSAWFDKKKKEIALEAKDLAGVIWKRTPRLIDMILSIEGAITILKNRADNSSIEINSNPKVNQVMEENGYYEKTLDRFKKLDLALLNNLEMRLTNLEKALSYFDDDRELKAIEKVKNKGLNLSENSKNISNLFSKLGG